MAKTKRTDAHASLSTINVESIDVVVTHDVTAVTLQAVNLNNPYADPIKVTGVARRNPADAVAYDIGRDLALGRALEALAQKLIKRANGRVRHLESCRQHQVALAEATTTKVVKVKGRAASATAAQG